MSSVPRPLMHLDDSNGLDIVRFIGAAKERPPLPFDRPRLVIQRPLHFTCRLRAFMPVLECHMQATKRTLRAHLADWLKLHRNATKLHAGAMLVMGKGWPSELGNECHKENRKILPR